MLPDLAVLLLKTRDYVLWMLPAYLVGAPGAGWRSALALLRAMGRTGWVIRGIGAAAAVALDPARLFGF